MASEIRDVRDWFAGQFLAGAGTWCPDANYGPVNWDDKAFVQKLRAEYAYQQADAMLDARAGGTAREEAAMLRDAIIEARRQLAKGRALWNGPCHQCDEVLEQALSAATALKREEVA